MLATMDRETMRRNINALLNGLHIPWRIEKNYRKARKMAIDYLFEHMDRRGYWVGATGEREEIVVGDAEGNEWTFKLKRRGWKWWVE